MTNNHHASISSFTISSNQPLIGLPYQERGRAVLRFFSTEELARTTDTIQEALHLAGAWSDLDWEEIERELNRIRYENTPTLPIENL